MNIVVVYSSGPRLSREWTLELPEGSLVQRALDACGAMQEFPELPELLATGGVSIGVWGRACSADRALADQDRVEIYRPLRVDPKVARRERFKDQGARGAGLFAKKRQGAKAGY
jgi:putative ubiquitin-RnfH superfamily antitoxin RatB of RatAB toxin-antitoxin module